jgi:hypothetical protein
MGRVWWSIEVLNGEFSAQQWQDAHGAAMVEAAITHGAREWNWAPQEWGTVFEVAFSEPEEWQRYRDLPGVRAALDAVPDPVRGLYVYPGRGGSSGAGRPRIPHKPLGAGAASLPVEPEPMIRVPAERQPPEISIAG